MNYRLLMTSIFLPVVVLLFLSSESSAQGRGRSSRGDSYINRLNRPAVSPYLNLFRENQLGFQNNYQTLVRPQLEQQRMIGRQQNQIQNLQREVGSVRQQQYIQTLPQTGHPAVFNYYSHFYNKRSR